MEVVAVEIMETFDGDSGASDWSITSLSNKIH